MLIAAVLPFLLQQPTPVAPAATLPHVQRVTHVVHAYATWAAGDRELVYQSNATGDWDIYAASADGTGVRAIVTSPAADITPVCSPDGARILFVSERDGQREVYVAARDGSDQRRLTADPGHDLHPVWHPAGPRVLFSSNRGNASADDYDLYTMHVDGSDVQRLTSGPDVDTYASWSPDGSRIVTRRVLAGTSDNEVVLLDASGALVRNLTREPASYDGWPVWSPDGRRIAYAGGGPAGQPPHRIYMVDAEGNGRTALTDAWAGSFVYDTQPCFSRDGTRLVFTRYRPGPLESADLCVVDVPVAG